MLGKYQYIHYPGFFLSLCVAFGSGGAVFIFQSVFPFVRLPGFMVQGIAGSKQRCVTS